jgi:serine/threonine protein kinase
VLISIQRFNTHAFKKESISRLVELLTIEPSGPAGVYECYIVTKPLIATTLSGILKSELDNHSRLVLVAQMLQGLDFIHTSGCMHRDIKLDNVLGSAQPLQAVIIDFGVATWDKTSSDHMKGTIRYLAPEIMAIKHMNAPANATYDQSADIWSVGLTIFEFLCRFKLNFHFITSSSHRNIMSQDHWNKQHASDQEVQNLFDLLKQMLAWDPSERISAKEALDWVNRHGIVIPTSPTLAAGMKNKLASPTLEPEADFGKRRRRSIR